MTPFFGVVGSWLHILNLYNFLLWFINFQTFCIELITKKYIYVQGDWPFWGMARLCAQALRSHAKGAVKAARRETMQRGGRGNHMGNEKVRLATRGKYVDFFITCTLSFRLQAILVSTLSDVSQGSKVYTIQETIYPNELFCIILICSVFYLKGINNFPCYSIWMFILHI